MAPVEQAVILLPRQWEKQTDIESEKGFILYLFSIELLLDSFMKNG